VNGAASGVKNTPLSCTPVPPAIENLLKLLLVAGMSHQSAR